jgi:hypothetical protein
MADEITLEYQVTLTQDWLKYSAFKSMKAVNPTLAVDRKANKVVRMKLHCDNLVVVKRDAADIGRYYAVRRKIREWTVPLDPNDREQTLGAYDVAPQELRMDSEDKPPGNWYDSPGPVTTFRFTGRLRTLTEWVIAVERPNERVLVPDAPGLYYMVVLDETPTHYRYRMSPGTTLTIAQVEEIFGETHGFGPLPPGSPWKTEADYSDTQWAARHAAWQDYTASNNDLPLSAPP